MFDLLQSHCFVSLFQLYCNIIDSVKGAYLSGAFNSVSVTVIAIDPLSGFILRVFPSFVVVIVLLPSTVPPTTFTSNIAPSSFSPSVLILLNSISTSGVPAKKVKSAYNKNGIHSTFGSIIF